MYRRPPSTRRSPQLKPIGWRTGIATVIASALLAALLWTAVQPRLGLPTLAVFGLVVGAARARRLPATSTLRTDRVPRWFPTDPRERPRPVAEE